MTEALQKSDDMIILIFAGASFSITALNSISNREDNT